jgi:alkylation response protein AidB-like acyl-CoA dehydrogenase
MNFDYNEEQQLLADSVRRYLAKSYDFEARKKIVAGQGWSPEAWAQFAEMGLMGLPVSAEHGGFGGGAVDLMGVMEAFGEALVVEPYLPLVLAVRLHELPGVVEGKTKLALAHNEKGARFSLDAVKTRASKKGAGWVLDGEKAAIIGAPVADHLVVSARDESGIALFLVDIGKVSLQAYRTMDERLAADVVMRGAEAKRIDGGRNELEEAIDFGTALICAEAVGAMKFACDTTLEYLKTRKQFGVPIGKFQVLQHRMVDCFTNAQEARSMTLMASLKIDDKDPAVRRKAASGAKVQIGKSGKFCGQSAVQMHGGMGVTDELSVSHYFKRLTMIDLIFGNQQHHLTRYSNLAMAA